MRRFAMINAVAGAVEKIPAPSRPSGEESLKRRETPQPMTAATVEQDSAVVEISSEGARWAQAKTQMPAERSEPALAPQAAANNEAAEKATASASAQPAASATQKSASPAKQGATSETDQFDEADANQDGTVNVLERRAYDFMHPTLARYPGSADEQTPRTVAAELKAYEAVARSGRNL
ncbi:hypothetical protein [Roseateles albus]|uniref:EF-hand domain-containing protein n=1 Tax=Roseateles albus TaxID=2987525 RepID=A0ABT5KBL4_9BURK|nr:hypothetical protein [Roseateles albus]MDC8771328.1 hypothetical protein [Roseateles albus]